MNCNFHFFLTASPPPKLPLGTTMGQDGINIIPESGDETATLVSTIFLPVIGKLQQPHKLLLPW